MRSAEEKVDYVWIVGLEQENTEGKNSTPKRKRGKEVIFQCYVYVIF